MGRRLAILAALAAGSWLVAIGIAQMGPGDWDIPAGATSLANPTKGSIPVINYGGTLYRQHCQRCHGEFGRGDGIDRDSDHPPGDLTDGSRAASNPDGVLFYKIWNGRRKPEMPAFRDTLTKEEVWALVHFLNKLRQPS